MNLNQLKIFILLMFSFYLPAEDSYLERQEVQTFIDQMVSKYSFDKTDLDRLLSQAKYQERVIRIMDRQPEGVMTWTRYRNIMVNKTRIDAGREFIKEYKEELLRAEDLYGVPASIIASIIGIETRYGRVQGNTRVIDSLMTLSFDYPRRSKFFKIQLEEFLLLCREENLDANSLKGSIAGAMGYGQFMPDSYRDYAIDFDQDGIRDLLGNPIDAIGSVANFLSKKGRWQANTPVAVRANAIGESFGMPATYKVIKGDNMTLIAKKLNTTIQNLAEENNLRELDFLSVNQILSIPRKVKLKSAFKPYLTIDDLEKMGISPIRPIVGNLKVTPIELTLDNGYEYWLGFDNYYSLSKYNRSKLYVMAVFEFSNSLSEYL